MEIYLLRHGIAYDLGDGGSRTDAERALSPDGKIKMYQQAEGMRQLDLKFDAILTSPLIRARETADIVAEVLRQSEKLEICQILALGADPEKVCTLLRDQFASAGAVLLVGHEPDLSLLGAYLISSRGDAALQMKKGSLCRIDSLRVVKAGGSLRWLLTPTQMRLLGKK